MLEEHRWAIKAHLIVRKIAGQVLEGFVLTDRLLWAKNINGDAALDWCMGGCSGRGFALWARK